MKESADRHVYVLRYAKSDVTTTSERMMVFV